MTTLTRWDPFGIEMPAWMTRFFDDRPRDWLFELDRSTSMRIEEYVDDDGMLVVRAEIPGVDPEKDVDISVHDGMLHIKAAREEKTEKKDKDFYRSEFRYGAFERMVPLPSGASAEDVKATYEDGVLEIRIPTAKEAPAAKVPVHRV